MDDNNFFETEMNQDEKTPNEPLEESSVNTSSDDDFVIGKGFQVAEYEQQTSGKKHRSHKGNSTIKSVVWIICIVAVSVGLAAGIILAGSDYLGIGFGRGEDCVMEIPQGAGTRVIAEKLEETGAVKWPFLFRVYSKLKGYDGQYKYGVYTFNNESGYEELCTMLMTDGAKAESVQVKIPEMSTIDEMAVLLADAGVCTKEDFIYAVQNGDFDIDFVEDIPEQKVYYRLEGYLFPDTYDFYCYDSEECAYLAVEKMLKTLQARLGSDTIKKMQSSEYTFHELMTMASIVELEAGGTPDEMANVAAVFFNRLKSPDFAKLESSPTKKYPHGNGRYDTYECLGLPPGPLCAPSLKSIIATLDPTKNFDYYYFVTDAAMDFYYNRTLAEHNSTIARLKRENNWIGDQ